MSKREGEEENRIREGGGQEKGKTGEGEEEDRTVADQVPGLWGHSFTGRCWPGVVSSSAEELFRASDQRIQY